jgi:type II restriction enzyme
LRLHKKIAEAQKILKALGLPTAQQNEISALTLLALVSIGPRDPWTQAKRTRQSVSKDIMAFIVAKYRKTYAPNTRETVRRQVSDQFVQARIAEYNPFELDLATNSPRAHYAVSESTLTVIKTYGTGEWIGAAADFITTHGSLASTYAKHRSSGKLVTLTLPDGSKIELSPGKHNDLQKAIVENFAPRFAPGATLLYIGDTAKKTVKTDTAALARLGLSASEHDKLPDVVLLDGRRGRLFLIEAVTSHGPMSPKRVFELNERLKSKEIGAVYVSAFPDMAKFRKHMSDIAWETAVWIAELPDHMIHFNGDRFLDPR